MAVWLPAAADGQSAAATNGSPEYTGFDIQYRQGTSGDFTAFTGEITVNPRNLSGAAQITGLTNGQAYEVQVRVTCASTSGPWSTSATGTPAPSAPGPVRNLTAKQLNYMKAADRPGSSNDLASIAVSWNPSGDNGGSPVTSYKFETFRGGTGYPISANPVRIAAFSDDAWDNPGSNKIEDATVEIDAAYVADNLWLRFTVAANNAVGTGWASTVDIRLNAGKAPNLAAANFTGTITSESTTSGAAPKLTVKLNSLPVPLPVGSRVVLFLEDDFQVPDSIPASSIYFVANSPASVATGNGAPVYVTEAPEIDTDDYFDDDRDDVSITVRIPDMCTRDSDECAGPNRLEQGQDLTMVILGSSGIKNPSEAGTHTVAFDVLGFDDVLPGRIERLMTGGMERSAAAGSIQKRQGVYLSTLAKISLSATKGNRRDMLTVNGSGFNNGVSAVAYVAQRKAAEFAVAVWWNTLNCDSRKTAMGAGNEFCFQYTLSYDMTYTVAGKDKAASDKVFARHLCKQGIISAGTEAGSATVGSDDRVAIPFEVSVPTFKPGNDNLICVEDGETRASGNVEGFELTPFIPEASVSEAPVSEALTPLGDSLMAVFYFDRISRDWLFYDSRPQFAGLNTLRVLVPGKPYWVLVTHDVDVVLGGKLRSFKCARGNC